MALLGSVCFSLGLTAHRSWLSPGWHVSEALGNADGAGFVRRTRLLRPANTRLDGHPLLLLRKFTNTKYSWVQKHGAEAGASDSALSAPWRTSHSTHLWDKESTINPVGFKASIGPSNSPHSPLLHSFFTLNYFGLGTPMCHGGLFLGQRKTCRNQFLLSTQDRTQACYQVSSEPSQQPLSEIFRCQTQAGARGS